MILLIDSQSMSDPGTAGAAGRSRPIHTKHFQSGRKNM